MRQVSWAHFCPDRSAGDTFVKTDCASEEFGFCFNGTGSKWSLSDGRASLPRQTTSVGGIFWHCLNSEKINPKLFGPTRISQLYGVIFARYFANLFLAKWIFCWFHFPMARKSFVFLLQPERQSRRLQLVGQIQIASNLSTSLASNMSVDQFWIKYVYE